MTVEPKPKRVMPKGGRKGGAIFPRIALKDAISYAKTLVGKTHVSAQPRDVIYSGVVGVKSGQGNVRISALKQYGFLKGDEKVNYSADDLAKDIASSPTEDLIPLYQKAALKPNIFKAMFDTFQGDTVSKARLKKRAADLNVHPEEAETCVEIYVSTLSLAELVFADADQVKHVSAAQLAAGVLAGKVTDQNDLAEEGSSGEANDQTGGVESADNGQDELTEGQPSRFHRLASSPPAAVNVTINIDSSMDVDKLQKQLELLKRFGAL